MDTDGNTLLNALLGAVATIVLSWIPLSPILGGVLAGYLQGGETADGAKVGALSGLFASLPLLVAIALLLVFVPFFPEPTFALAGAFFVLIAILVVIIYGTAFGALGGVLGIYVRDEL